ncbi:short-chain dehydrogenase [Achaetomium macrosporum]|uniref:Short-chain dehydrogenase n=1 Tax=Achaetomium macrosporum TaxID=79813 RepID=A0AAN7C4W4_9PEZI|nr:short-chain dehydrogenase [Achaetomium macrosporum]
MSVPGKLTILITGCSPGGMGAALAAAFHSAGHHVYATARNPFKLVPLANQGLDILVKNAAAVYMMPLADAPLDAARDLFYPNFFTQLVGVYNASKAALAMLTATLRLELAALGARVVDIKTRGMRTNIIGNSNVNDPSRGDHLPGESVYAPAREAVERAMSQEGFRGKGVPAEQWAREVAGLSLGKNPRVVIWKGEGAALVRVANAIPWGGLFEGMVKKMTALDVVEGIMREGSADGRA